MIDNEAIKKIFGSNTRIKLFDLFFNNQDKKYYVREITRIIDEQINSVRRELNNLHQIGLIKKTEEDRKLYYSLNHNFELYESLSNMFDNDYNLKKQVKTSFGDIEEPTASFQKINWKNQFRPILSILDQAYVVENFSVQDNVKIDLLLVGNNLNGKISQWASQFESKIGREFNYMIISKEEFDYRKAVKDSVLLSFLQSKIEKIY